MGEKYLIFISLHVDVIDWPVLEKVFVLRKFRNWVALQFPTFFSEMHPAVKTPRWKSWAIIESTIHFSARKRFFPNGSLARSDRTLSIKVSNQRIWGSADLNHYLFADFLVSCSFMDLLVVRVSWSLNQPAFQATFERKMRLMNILSSKGKMCSLVSYFDLEKCLHSKLNLKPET